MAYPAPGKTALEASEDTIPSMAGSQVSTGVAATRPWYPPAVQSPDDGVGAAWNGTVGFSRDGHQWGFVESQHVAEHKADERIVSREEVRRLGNDEVRAEKAPAANITSRAARDPEVAGVKWEGKRPPAATWDEMSAMALDVIFDWLASCTEEERQAYVTDLVSRALWLQVEVGRVGRVGRSR